MLSVRARNVPSDASAAEAELKPQQLFEFDADAHDEASGAQPSLTYKNGHWLLKSVAGDPDAEFPGEITIEHLVEHTVFSLTRQKRELNYEQESLQLLYSTFVEKNQLMRNTIELPRGYLKKLIWIENELIQ